MSMADERVENSNRGEGEDPPKRDGSKTKAKAKKQRSKGANIALWILRKSIVPVIMVIMLIAGLYAGYVVLGKQPEDEVFSWSTWQHLYDLVFADS
ncbi:DNA-directed RNA polymerase subunit beta [Paenibacillus sp. 2TAB19]|uniref:DNA-directed RNA polymerase subunit beta n=1 Tax=Paenibacillus sp. 2TAB19 TaxID=3233003 RepID=UPI003F9D7E9A